MTYTEGMRNVISQFQERTVKISALNLDPQKVEEKTA
jgi:hypothetical protein